MSRRRRVNKNRKGKSRYVEPQKPMTDLNGNPYPEQHEIGITRYEFVGRNWTARQIMEIEGECLCCIDRLLGDPYDE